MTTKGIYHTLVTQLDKLARHNRQGSFRTKDRYYEAVKRFRASYRHFLDRNSFSGEGLNLHRCRHTYASMLLEQEINPKIVQKLLGHRDVSTTLGIYTLKAYTAGGNPGRFPAVLAGSGGYAAAAGGGVTPKNPAKNKKPFCPML